MEEDGRDPDEITALEAVWGREASASAPGSPRPDLAAVLGRSEPDVGGPGPGPRRPRRGPVLAGLAVAVVGAVVAAVVLAGGGDDPVAEPAPSPEDAAPTPTPTTTVPGADALGALAWSAATVCPRFEDPVTGSGRTACTVVVDDERAYVLVDVTGTRSVRALDAATGQVRWEAPFPEGAGMLERMPSVVVVGGVGGQPDTADGPGTQGVAVALDPLSGERLWSAPGQVVGAVGRDHLIVDATPLTREHRTMTVVEAATGREVLRREGDGVAVDLHPCDGMVLASEGDRLTAHDVVDGAARWSVPAPHLDAYRPVVCGSGLIAYVDEGTLLLFDRTTTAQIGTAAVPTSDVDTSKVLAMVGDTVVVGSLDGVRGYRADGGTELLWHLPCVQCGPDLPVGAAGDDVAVVLGGQVVVRRADGAPGPEIDLRGRAAKVLDDGTLLAWGLGRLVVADTADLGRAATVDLDVRSAVASATHVVVATLDEVRAYAREG